MERKTILFKIFLEKRGLNEGNLRAISVKKNKKLLFSICKFEKFQHSFEFQSNESPQILAGMNRFLNNNPSMQTQNLEAPIFDSNPASNTKMIGASVK